MGEGERILLERISRGGWKPSRERERRGRGRRYRCTMWFDQIQGEKIEHLQNISDSKKEFRGALTAKGVPGAICDLLFEKYVEKKKRRGEMDHRPVKRRVVGTAKFFTTITDCKVSGRVCSFEHKITDSDGRKLLYVRDCYDSLYEKVVDLAPSHTGVIVTGTSGIGKTFLGVSIYCSVEA